MKFKVEKAVIAKSLAHVQSVVERRTTIPVLANVKLEAAEGKIKLTATDTEISVTETISAIVDEPANITLPAQMLYEIIRKMPDGSEVEFKSTANDQVEVKCGRSKFKLQSLPVDQFPIMEQGDLPNNFALSARDLLSLIDKVRFAISNEETRYYLNGIYVHVAEDGDTKLLRSAATDGHRLARATLPLPAGAEGLPGIIIPKKTVGELKKLLSEYSGEVWISASENKIRFTMGDAVIVSKLIDGKFPDYERVIPHNNDRILEVGAAAFSQAIDRVSTVSFEKARAIKLLVGENSITIEADSADGNTAHEELEASYSSEPVETGYNFRYLLDMLGQIESDTVQILLSDSASPALVRDPSDVSVLYVIMPMRV